MNTATTLAFGAGAFILYSLFRKGMAAGNLVFRPYNLKGIRLDGITPVMTLGLAIQNTSNQSFTLQSLAGEVYANKYLIGNVGSFKPQTVHPNSETVIYIDCRLSIIGIVTDIINAIRNKTFSHTIELESTANIDNLQVPVDLSYKFGK